MSPLTFSLKRSLGTTPGLFDRTNHPMPPPKAMVLVAPTWICIRQTDPGASLLSTSYPTGASKSGLKKWAMIYSQLLHGPAGRGLGEPKWLGPGGLRLAGVEWRSPALAPPAHGAPASKAEF